MDSITQIALGAAVGSAVLGRRAGYRAPLWGAVLGTLPDLDVLIPMGGPVADFTYHRGFSHSLLVLAALAPLLAWAIRRIHGDPPETRHGWRWFCLLVLLTHPVLDAFTIYGTQLLWPLDDTPIGLGSIFIVDPFYTLPLILGCGAFLWLRRNPELGLRLNGAGLVISTLYLLWSASAQQWVSQQAQHQLAAQGVEPRQLLVHPTPLNTLLWRVLAVTETGYSEGFYSLFDRQPLSVRHYPSHENLLDNLQHHWPVQRLRWFSKGFYRVGLDGQEVVISDLRMGLEPNYIFNFRVAEWVDGRVEPSPDEFRRAPRSLERLPRLWVRIWRQPTASEAPGF